MKRKNEPLVLNEGGIVLAFTDRFHGEFRQHRPSSRSSEIEERNYFRSADVSCSNPNSGLNWLWRSSELLLRLYYCLTATSLHPRLRIPSSSPCYPVFSSISAPDIFPLHDHSSTSHSRSNITPRQQFCPSSIYHFESHINIASTPSTFSQTGPTTKKTWRSYSTKANRSRWRSFLEFVPQFPWWHAGASR